MGVVYVGFDEDLDRKVAIKLLRGELSKDDRGRTRMLREAQALARLSHPNVVQVHEVGQWADHDYVAMEYVGGQTLDRWLSSQPRSWREVLDVLIQAGRGLEAAHTAELVHRDFKPANLLVGSDGRARVLDFGLARATNEGETLLAISPSAEVIATAEHDVPDDSHTSHELSGSTVASSAFDKLLTVTGAVLGTPAYMAPEQHLGQLANALSDQFSFCVVLYEALYGQRPFKGSSRTEYALHVTEGKLEAPPVNAGVPLWLRKIVMRGLAPKPEQRWPSMTVLLAELSRDRTRTWRGAVVAAGLLLAFGVALSLGGEEPKLCEPDWAAVADTWGPEQRQAVRVAFGKTSMQEADGVLAHTERSLDAYAQELVGARAQACEARWVARSQTDAQLELRHACLEQRERELGAVVDMLADADREVVLHSPELLAGLGDVGLCARVDLLEAGTPAPKDAEAVARIAEVRRMIAGAHAARDVGRIEEAKALTAAGWRSAKQLGYEPLLGALHSLDGQNLRTSRNFTEARKHLIAAVALAQRNNNHELAAEVWLSLASLEARQGVDPDESLEFNMATGAVERLGAPDRHQALLAFARGLSLFQAGQPGRALPEFERALEFCERGFSGSEHICVRALAVRADAFAALGRAKEARADLEAIISAPGSWGRARVDSLFALGVVEVEQGEYELAERHLRDAITGYEALFGPAYDSIGHALLALANVSLNRGDIDDAEDAVAAALQIIHEDHAEHDWALDALASVKRVRGDFDEAERILRRALAHRERTNADDEAQRAYLHGRLASALRDNDRLDEAVAEFDRAIALLDKSRIEAPLDLAAVLLGRGEIRLAQGQPELALDSLERALELAPADCGNPWLAGHVRVKLAEALAQLDTRRDEQQRLAREAIELLSTLPNSAEVLAQARILSNSRSHSQPPLDERKQR
jgi:tetratricopeptide (TPR) repeat protein